VRGDEVSLAAGSDASVDKLDSGSPRRPTRLDYSGGTTSLVYDLGGSADEVWGTDVLCVAGFNSNLSQISIYGVTAAGTATLLGTVDLWDGLEFQATLTGRTLRPDTGASNIDTATLAYDELDGQRISLPNGAGTERLMRTITGNREGRWDATADNRTAIHVESAPGTWVDGAARVIPSEWCVLIDMRGAEYETIRIDIPQPTAANEVDTPEEGHWQIGYLRVGHLIAHAYQPSWGNRITEEVQTEVLRSRDGQRDGVKLAPLTRRMRIGWVDGINVYKVINATFDQDGDWFDLSDNSSAEGIGQAGLVLYSHGGVLRRTRGGLDPIVYLPRVARFASDDRVQLLNRREQVVLAHIDTPVARDRVVGEDQHGFLLRGDVWELEEAT
jgi:hypothetical protein